jgi:hypothetical protein
MAAVSQKIPNLLGGVSQQPDPVKLPGQVRAAENVYLDPTFGCRKRPGTESVATLASDVPADARWFSIFRDNNERYAVTIYTEPSLVVRVWDLNDGSERSVTFSDSAKSYFSGASQTTIEQVTIADYTLITNTLAEVSMNTDTSADATKEALVTIDQVAYNTVYSIDLQKDGDTEPNKVYRATGIEVIPGSYELDDGGSCSGTGADSFLVNSGSKTGLSFRIVDQCSAYLVGGSGYEYRVNDVGWVRSPNNLGDGGTATTQFDGFRGDWFGFPIGEVKVYNSQWRSDSRVDQTLTDNYGGQVIVETEDIRSFSDAKYMSRHKVDVQLLNGGEGWRAGDTATVSMNGRSYTVRVTSDAFSYAYNSAGTASFTTVSNTEQGTLNVGAVVTGLADAVNQIADFSTETTGNVIKIANTAGRDFNVSVRGGVTNRAMTVVKGVARDIADLPSQCFDGYRVKVINTDEADADDYYVRFTTEAPGIPGAGSWSETVAPGIKTTINSSTMPHALIRQADGSFTLDALNSDSAFNGWASREVGDEKTNPEPTFVGRSISNMFFFSNRLGFLSEDAVIMSQPGDYFNFFATSALAVSDADPIDVTASSTTPAILKAAIGSPKGLILFAERSQFLMSTSEIAFAASTVKLTEISQYFYKSEVLPLSTGVSVAFISENFTYSKVMELAIDSVENRPVVADITRIVPEYLPPSFVWGEVSPNNNIILYGDNSENIYVFKFFNNGDKRELAGWTRWTYPAGCHMFAMEDDLCHIILFDGTKHMLVRSELIDDPEVAPLDVGFSSFSPRLDMSVPSTELTIEDDPDSILTSRVYIPDEINIPGAQYTFISTDGGFKGLFTNPPTEVDDSGALFIVVSKDLTSANAVLGISYDTLVTLPAIFIAQEGKADRVNVPQVTFLYLELYYSGRYQVTVNKLGYDPKIYDIEVTPANSYDANNVPLSEISTESIPIFSSGDILEITVRAPDPFPSSITGYSWEGTYNNRGVKPIR